MIGYYNHGYKWCYWGDRPLITMVEHPSSCFVIPVARVVDPFFASSLIRDAVSRVNLLAQISFVMFSMTAIIFFASDPRFWSEGGVVQGLGGGVLRLAQAPPKKHKEPKKNPKEPPVPSKMRSHGKDAIFQTIDCW